MIFPKKQAQRLIPEYLLDYTTKLNESHPDPTESWGGSGGSDYTAGDGINITNNVISVDDTIAKKSEIPTNYVTLDTEQTITSPKTINSQLNFGDGIHNSILINADYANNPIISMLKDTTGGEFSIGVDDSAYFTYEDNNGLKKYKLPYQDATGLNTYTLATLDDIPTIPTLATVATTGSYNDLNDKPDLSIYAQSSNLSTVATTGSYNDLLDKPTIPDTSKFVTTDTMQKINGSKTFTSSICTEVNYGGTSEGYRLYIHTDEFQYEHFNGNDYREGINFHLPISKPSGTIHYPSYTLATTDDIHNPTITFTQGGTTKGTITLNQSGDQTIEFDAGGSGGGGDTPANMVTTDTNQDITGEKTFVGNKRIKLKQSGQYDRVGFTGFDYNGTEIGYLEMSKMDNSFTGNPISNILGYYSSINSAPAPSSDVMLGFKYSTLDSDGNARIYNLVVPPRYNELRATRYIPISVNGTTADNTGNINVPTQTLVFTLADNSTVTLNVMTSPTASTTTTS